MLRVLLALALLCWSPGALAQDDGRTRLAEYGRLVQQMQARAARNAWDGVERSYQALKETGIPLTADEHHIGAQAASHRGDLATTRERLEAALGVLAEPEYREWIARIEEGYGPVSMRGDPGRVSLEREETPFDRTQARAIAFAKEQVEETGTFEGLLPAGEYTFGSVSVRVRPGVQTQRIDIRSDRYMRRLERVERRESRQEEGEGS